MSKLDAKVFSSITPFSKQWILGDELMYEFLNQYQDFLSEGYGIIDLGSLDWGYEDPTFRFKATLSIAKRGATRAVQIFSDKDYECLWHGESYESTWNKVMYLAFSNSEAFVYIHDHDYTTVEAFTAAMQGHYLVFPLADNIGRVEMGHLTWQRNAANPGGFSVPGTEMQTLGIKQGLCNLYCSKLSFYSGSFSWDIFANVPDKSIAKNVGNYALYAKDTDYTVAADFKASLANVYLYYEKE